VPVRILHLRNIWTVKSPSPAFKEHRQLALLLDGLAWSHAVTPIVKRPILAA
jgi:hypothetical protein